MYTWDIMQETHLLHNDYVYAWLSSNTRIKFDLFLSFCSPSDPD